MIEAVSCKFKHHAMTEAWRVWQLIRFNARTDQVQLGLKKASAAGGTEQLNQMLV